MPGIDKKDEAILRELRKNGRITLTELGNRVNLSPASVKNRLEKLEKLGAVKGYTAVVDPAFLNEFIQALIEVELMVDDDRTDRTLYRLAELEHVQGIYRRTGESQILIRANFSDIDNLRKFLGELSRKYFGKNMKRAEVTIILDTIKESGIVIPKRKGKR
ncbi:Lrp/AsnC family transcriptional regulator [Thermococcus sp.]